jgi:hypothetical protein
MAQINRGNFMLGGNISASHSETTITSSPSKTKVNSVSNSAIIAFFPINNFCIGLATPYDVQNTKYSGSSYPYTTTTTTYGIKPFLRYYIPLSSSLFVLTEGMGILTHNRYKQQFELNGFTGESKGTGGNFGFGLGTGIAFRLNSHALLELEGNYHYIKSNNKTDNATNHIKSTNNKLFLTVGLNFLLPGK